MNRYYLPAPAWQPPPAGEPSTSLTLGGEEAKHCSRVMRAKVGDKVELFDGAGRSAICEITRITRDQVQCTPLQDKHQPPCPHPITLCQAIPKGGNMELIVQKAVELGVSAIQPLVTAHTVARPEALEKKTAQVAAHRPGSL